MPTTEIVLRFRRLIWRALGLPGPPPGVTLDDANDLFDKGVEYNELGMHRQALEVARELAGYRFTGAWEIEAVARHELGDSDRAIQVLRKSVSKAPVWRNGHLLGIYLSDASRYEEALKALDASLEMFGAQPTMTRYNRAVVLSRCGHLSEATDLLLGIICSDSALDEPEALQLSRAFLARLQTDAPELPPRRRQTRRVTRSRRIRS